MFYFYLHAHYVFLSSGRARKSASTSNLGQTDEAQKKFGNAKGISSDQFFGSSKDSEVIIFNFEKRTGSNY